MDKISGMIVKVNFYSEENGYTIAVIEVDSQCKNILVKNIEIGFGSDIETTPDNTIELFTSSPPYYVYKDPTNETNRKELEVLWYNKSSDIFTVINKEIYFPISIIRGLGNIKTSEILEERKKGKFKDIYVNFILFLFIFIIEYSNSPLLSVLNSIVPSFRFSLCSNCCSRFVLLYNKPWPLPSLSDGKNSEDSLLYK